MYGSTDSPFSTAFLARRPAPSITEGLLVLVQLVIADMTTEPIKKTVAMMRSGGYCDYYNI